MNKIELLSPAGSFDSLKAAVQAGCDAVYLGGSLYGARAYADNFDTEEMKRAIDYVHLREKKIYLTVNTLLKTKEMEEHLYDYIKEFYEQGLDAVIVQDFGVMQFLFLHFPDISIHASTQMSLMMAQGANLLSSYGVKRVVPARELSLSEIKRFKADTSMEIETFIHGALCYSYSGQCLMSSMIGGRSGNRGRCAQPCRKAYTFLKEGKSMEEAYFLSPKDLCTLTRLSDFVKAGVHSLKIEGRMKRAEYVAGVTAAYRRQLDLILQYEPKEWEKVKHTQTALLQKEVNQLKELYHRGGFCEGYLDGTNKAGVMSLDCQSHGGVLIGKVKALQEGSILVTLCNPVDKGDIIEIRSKKRLLEFTVASKQTKELVLNCKRNNFVKTGDLVYRMKNESLLNQLSNLYRKEEKKIGLHAKVKARCQGFFELTLVSKQGISVVASFEPLEKAVSSVSDLEGVKMRLRKTKDTPFLLETIELDVEEGLFLPVSSLNEVRREALTKMQEAILFCSKRKAVKREIRQKQEAGKSSQTLPGEKSKGFSVQISSMEQLASVCDCPEVFEVICPVDLPIYEQAGQIIKKVKQAGKRFVLALPRICRADTYDWLLKEQKSTIFFAADGFLVHNLEEVSWISLKCRDFYQDKQMISDFNLYGMNKLAANFLRNQGVDVLTLPVELTWQECKELGQDPSFTDMIVYGRLPLMVSALCLAENTKNCQKERREQPPFSLALLDQEGFQFPISQHCRFCYSMLYNSVPLQLLDFREELLLQGFRSLRFFLTTEGEEETKVLFEQWTSLTKTESKNHTKGHMKRGVL